MNDNDKKRINQLADALLADTLLAENPTDLYHSLERLEKGMKALESLCYVKEATQ